MMRESPSMLLVVMYGPDTLMAAVCAVHAELGTPFREETIGDAVDSEPLLELLLLLLLALLLLGDGGCSG
jgi:hypothetical protein